VLANERDRTLALALSRLPADARVALLLAARGMGAAEIGLVIRRTPSATRTYICRSRVRLRDELSELGIRADR
jgi:DNA-directed RNA polymerase specialized sigma24 family protein